MLETWTNNVFEKIFSKDGAKSKIVPSYEVDKSSKGADTNHHVMEVSDVNDVVNYDNDMKDVINLSTIGAPVWSDRYFTDNDHSNQDQSTNEAAIANATALNIRIKSFVLANLQRPL